MLAKKNRIKNSKDFAIIHCQGNFFSFRGLSLIAKKNGTKKTRVGISIGLKFSKKAVIRNLTKRRLQEIVRKNFKNIKKGWDLVIHIKKREKENLTSATLEDDFRKLLEKANLIIK